MSKLLVAVKIIYNLVKEHNSENTKIRTQSNLHFRELLTRFKVRTRKKILKCKDFTQSEKERRSSKQ